MYLRCLSVDVLVASTTPPLDPAILAQLTPEQRQRLARALAPALKAVEQEHADKVDVAQWMEANFWVPDLMTPDNPEPRKGLIVLMPHVKTLLRYIFDPKRSITEYFQTIVWTVPKKSAKTSISAGVGRWIAEQKGPYSDVVFVANDREQAKGRAYEYAVRSMELDPRWDIQRDELRVPSPAGANKELLAWYTSQQGAFYFDGGKLRAIAKDYKGEAGANQNASFFTEIAFMSEERARRLWDELTPPPTRWAIRWAEGYAGFFGEGVLWQELWELFRDINDANKLMPGARRLTHQELEPYGGWVNWRGEPFIVPGESDHGGPLLEDPPLYVNDTARAVGYIDQGVLARRMPWQMGEMGAAYYAAQERTERPEAMRRLHYNEWANPIDAFIPPEWWDACRLERESSARSVVPVGGTLNARPWRMGSNGKPLIPALDAHTPLVVGVDASVTGDCSAIIGVSRAPWAPNTEVIVRTARIFTPPTTERGGRKIGLDYAVTIEAELKRLVSNYNVACVAYDPYQMHMLAQNLLRGRSTRMGDEFGYRGDEDAAAFGDGLDSDSDLEVWMMPFSQAGMRNEADKMLYDLIRDRRIWHHGDPELTQHIYNAAAKTAVNEDTKLRIIKKAPSAKIDGCVALAMACYQSLHLNLV